MKVVALISGGKDSTFNMMECVRHGHEIVALANLHPADLTVNNPLHFRLLSPTLFLTTPIITTTNNNITTTTTITATSTSTTPTA